MPVRMKVLGCSGGIGGRLLHTTALLVDGDVLIDAGTGVGDLGLDELARIDHVFLTHSHLDHIACLPLMVDSVGDLRASPIVVYGVPETLAALRDHIFNGVVWPDFTCIPSPQHPFVRFEEIQLGEVIEIGFRRFTALPVNHSVPAVAWQVDSGAGSAVFSGDTGPSSDFWAALEGVGNLRHLVVECAFPNDEAGLAELSMHLCPRTLAAGLGTLKRRCEVHVSHLKPARREETIAELSLVLVGLRPRMLCDGDVLEF